MIWFSSDFHYNHTNLCYGESTWKDKDVACKKFNTLKEMNSHLINNINAYIKEDDELYFLGDWSFGGVNSVWECRKQINCKTIYFIPGNHDYQIVKNSLLADSGLDILNTKELFTAILPKLYTIKFDKQEFVLSHFPLQEWENMDKGAIMLHGHCHNCLDTDILNTKYKRMDVCFNDKPFSLDEILETMKNRKIRQRHERN
jgi:calcineurin-like phosphoesterase family protein